MSDAKNSDEAARRKVNRRAFARTSVAAGAAAVAFPQVLAAQAAPAGAPPPVPGKKATVPAAGAAKVFPQGWREGTTIPAEFYLDARHFHEDERYLADHLWQLVDHQSRIPDPGDYFVFEFGRGESVIILRDTHGKVKGFHNVCRHRGSRLCRDSDDPRPDDARLSVRQSGAGGNTPLFRCPYHAWTYDLDGRLSNAYGMPKDFDPAQNGLIPCHLRVEHGHIFVNLSRQPQPPEFESTAQALQSVGGKYGIADLKVAARRFYPIKANWKLALENFMECYHCGPSHRSLVTTHNWDYAISEEQKAQKMKDLASWVCTDPRRRAAEQQGMGAGSYGDYMGELNPGFLTGSLDGKPLAPLLPRIKDWAHCTEIAATSWSTGYWQAYDDHVAVARFTPRDAARTDCEIFWLVNPAAVEGRDYQVDRLIALWDITIREDIWIVENNHLGITSRAYGPGRYAPHESMLADFVKWYMAEVARA